MIFLKNDFEINFLTQFKLTVDIFVKKNTLILTFSLIISKNWTILPKMESKMDF